MWSCRSVDWEGEALNRWAAQRRLGGQLRRRSLSRPAIEGFLDVKPLALQCRQRRPRRIRNLEPLQRGDRLFSLLSRRQLERIDTHACHQINLILLHMPNRAHFTREVI